MITSEVTMGNQTNLSGAVILGLEYQGAKNVATREKEQTRDN